MTIHPATIPELEAEYARLRRRSRDLDRKPIRTFTDDDWAFSDMAEIRMLEILAEIEETRWIEQGCPR